MGEGMESASPSFGGPMDRIERMLAPAVEALGYQIVRVQLSGRHRPVLQVMAERRDGMPMSVDDCARISRTVSALLDVEDPIASAYTLEVSSPGIDRPLIKPEDFTRFAGFEAKLETKAAIAGRRRFKGKLGGLTDGNIVKLVEETGEIDLPLQNIQKARLVMTDELLAAGSKRH
jgi:ribosome maturation factor RimP